MVGFFGDLGTGGFTNQFCFRKMSDLTFTSQMAYFISASFLYKAS